MLGRHHDLIEVKHPRIHGDKTCERAVSFGDHNLGAGHEFVAPAFAPPVKPRGEIDLRVCGPPRPQPQGDRGVFVARFVAS